ncbi:hypothetical protein CU254_12520 [Amycolatopsis sp. AA4]|uniref:hypothetical protein n=1 Tax=Actinomycetes TaxID=1760 RepID=UPI0001B55FFD|nr:MULTISPECIES: hypothetical protein [Actinomycetes]ATY11200.1 hypothetical protein CU254_12520 [Amycolatopsis sp. AA4]EFL06781.1 predicted protein [Streptomyces sp. AA4]
MDEHNIENHPELMDPDWQRHAEKEAWTGLRRQRRRTRWRRLAAIWAAVVVVVAGAGFYLWKQGTRAEEVAGSTPAAPVSTTTAPAPTSLPDSAHVDLSRPFLNTPAQNWPEGIAGLAVPAPAKVGTFSAKQVGDAQEQVKHAVEVAQFDKNVLEGHRADGYLGLFAPDSRAHLQDDPQSLVVYLQDGYRLLPVSPRMTGKMTVRPGEAGELYLHVSYVVAYAFDPGNRVIEGPGDLEPFVRTDADYVMRSGSAWAPGSRGLWLAESSGYSTEVSCVAAKQRLLAPAFADPDFTGPSLSPEPGQFDPDKPAPVKGNCKE